MHGDSGENRRKNEVRRFMLENFNALQQTYSSPEGNTWIEVKEGVFVNFNWVGEGVSRVLHVSVTGTA